MIKVDKGKLQISGLGIELLAELALVVNHIAKTCDVSHKDILMRIDCALDMEV